MTMRCGSPDLRKHGAPSLCNSAFTEIVCWRMDGRLQEPELRLPGCRSDVACSVGPHSPFGELAQLSRADARVGEGAKPGSSKDSGPR
jgi:hypothetical protein